MERRAEKINKYTIEPVATLIQAMKQMDIARTKALLVSDNDIFLGMITIGDLQRAIIANKPFVTPIGVLLDNSKKVYAQVSDDLEDIKKWMLEVRAEMMPVLDAERHLVKVIFWDELFNATPFTVNRSQINIPVVIMAGGKGTRLKPLTNVIPKPLIPLGEKTILESIMEQYEHIGCKKFYLSVNYKADMIKYYISQLKHQYDVSYFQEANPLGTIGSVSMLKGKIDTPFFVTNCDIIIEQDYRDVYEYHQGNHNAITIVTAVKNVQIPYGVIETGVDGLMIGLQEKPDFTYMINTGVYILQPELIDEIPEGEFYHITDLIEKVKASGGRVGCFPVSDDAWHDIGEWHGYLKKNIHYEGFAD